MELEEGGDGEEGEDLGGLVLAQYRNTREEILLV